MDLVQSIAPTFEPLTVPDAEYHLKIDADSDISSDIVTQESAYLESLIAAARTKCEQETSRQLCTATWVLKLPFFPRAGCTNRELYGVPQARFMGPDDWRSIYLPKPPAASVTSVTYYDSAGDSQTFSSTKYTLILGDPVARIALNYAEVWPTTRQRQDAVTITYVSGKTQATVPAGIKHAMRLMIGNWYENREAVNIGNTTSALPFGVDALLQPYRVMEYV